MAFDTKYVYTFGIAEGASPEPRTTCFGNLVTMYIDSNTPGNFAHEIRHGGQLSLGMYCINGEYGGVGYCPKIEREAYQAQLAFAGEVTFRFLFPEGLLYDQTYVSIFKIEDKLIPLITDKDGNKLYPF